MNIVMTTEICMCECLTCRLLRSGFASIQGGKTDHLLLEALEEFRLSTTMLITMKIVVKDQNDYIYFLVIMDKL